MSKNLTLKHMVAGGIEEAGSSNIGASHHPIVISNGTMTKRIMLDMGARPSNTFDRSVENPLVDVDINTLDALFISHCHQDHIGSVIRLVKAGYHGPIYMSERSKALARVIFEDMLKHEKEDVAEHNRKVKNIQQDLTQAWFISRLHIQAPETRHIKNPHDRIPDTFYSVEGLYETRVEELLWKFNVRRQKDASTVKETLFNRKHNEKLTKMNLENMHWDKGFDKEEIIHDLMGIKKEIMYTQDHFSQLQYDHAKSLLAKYRINEREDIAALDRRLEVMAFNDADVMQALSQLHGLKLEEYYDIFPGLFKVIFYNAGHVEGSVQTVGTIYNDKGEESTFMFTGDMGRSKQPGLSGKPAIPKEKLDYVMMEGTYGDRVHEDRAVQTQKMIEDIAGCKSMVLLPCFALQRFQEIICVILDAVHSKKLKLGSNEKIYCQSPLAMGITKEFINFDKAGVYRNLTESSHIQWLTEKEDVEELLRGQGRRIVICSGGMLEKGTITQYIDEINEDKHAKIILTGYQVPGTNGYKLLHNDFTEPVRLNNKTISGNQAQMSTYSFSGHGDHDELLSHFFALNLSDPCTLTLVHGGLPRHVLGKDIETTWKNDRGDKKLIINIPEKNGETYSFER